MEFAQSATARALAPRSTAPSSDLKASGRHVTLLVRNATSWRTSAHW